MSFILSCRIEMIHTKSLSKSEIHHFKFWQYINNKNSSYNTTCHGYCRITLNNDLEDQEAIVGIYICIYTNIYIYIAFLNMNKIPNFIIINLLCVISNHDKVVEYFWFISNSHSSLLLENWELIQDIKWILLHLLICSRAKVIFFPSLSLLSSLLL